MFFPSFRNVTDKLFTEFISFGNAYIFQLIEKNL